MKRGVQTPAEAAPRATCVAVAMHTGHISSSAVTAVLGLEVESGPQAAVHVERICARGIFHAPASRWRQTVARIQKLT